MGPCFFLLDHLFCLSHRKTRWTMSVDFVGLKICLVGTSTSMVTLILFPWCKPKGPKTSSTFTSNQRSYRAMGK